MKDTLIFGTTNEGKLQEAKEILGLNVEGISVEVDEIQSLDPIEVATKKAQDYFKKVKKPLFIEDTSFFIEDLNGLPGTFIDYFMKSIGNTGLIRIAQNKKARALTTLVYINENEEYHVFQGEVKGTIAETERGDKGFGWDPIFIPDGETQTFAELEPDIKNKYSMRGMALREMKEFFEKQQ